jgi:hypothetical protein
MVRCWYYGPQMPKRTLRFLQYSIHAHLESGNPDYLVLFRGLTGLQGKHRKHGKRVTAIGTAMLTKGATDQDRLLLIIYTGDDDQNVLFFDLNAQTEFNASTEPGRFVARKTHVLIDPTQRTLLIESGRGHPSADDLAQFIEEEAQSLAGFEALELSFAPVPTLAFSEKITGMQRIQSATVSLARPNVDWSDRHDQLTQYAAESNAKVIDTTVRAGRNESLSKDSGLISNLKHWLTDTLPSVVNAKIRGSADDQSPLTELKLSDFVETVTLTVDVSTETKQPSDQVIQESLNGYLDSKGEENG